MPKIADPWRHHDWDSRGYVADWAERQEEREIDRQEPFRLLAKTLPYGKDAAIHILDLGAGYGALSQFLLNHFSRGTALCQDGSAEMAKLGRKRMTHNSEQFISVACRRRDQRVDCET
jgi:ubiquinone/menaquinone biosynthesis C-methylase UbiE